LVYTFVDGWVMGLDYTKVNPLNFDLHTVGYLIIATIYIVFAFKQ